MEYDMTYIWSICEGVCSIWNWHSVLRGSSHSTLHNSVSITTQMCVRFDYHMLDLGKTSMVKNKTDLPKTVKISNNQKEILNHITVGDKTQPICILGNTVITILGKNE